VPCLLWYFDVHYQVKRTPLRWSQVNQVHAPHVTLLWDPFLTLPFKSHLFTTSYTAITTTTTAASTADTVYYCYYNSSHCLSRLDVRVRRSWFLTVATVVARNANQAMVVPVLGFFCKYCTLNEIYRDSAAIMCITFQHKKKGSWPPTSKFRTALVTVI
jgi:hypothetical protein